MISELRHIVRGTPDRRSRVHTVRGDRLRGRAWFDALRAVGARLTRRRPDGPWLVPDAVRWLDDHAMQDWRVLELGAGSSTPWLSCRVEHVVSLEHDPAWTRHVQRALDSWGIANCELRHLDLVDMPDHVSSFPDAAFDLVLVDCEETDPPGIRVACIAQARSKVRPGGWLILDDSDDTHYATADQLLAGWAVKRFIGTRPTPLLATETSVYGRRA